MIGLTSVNSMRAQLRLAASTLVIACGTIACVALAPASAVASVSGPRWTVTSVSRPTVFTPGDTTGEEAYVVTITNTGGSASDGTPITVTDELPGGAAGVSLDPSGASGEDVLAPQKKLGGETHVKLECVFAACTYSHAVIPDDTLVVRFPIDVPAGALSPITNVVRVSGGGAPDASVSTPTAIGGEPAKFGISPGGASTALSTTQAGAHPDVTTSIAFNTVNSTGALAEDAKNTVDEFPAGFASDFVDTPGCTAAQFLQSACPIDTQVGVVTLTLIGKQEGEFMEPVYNLSPDPGEVAKLGFPVDAQFFFEGAFTLRPGDYGATVTFPNINQGLIELDNVALTVWGVPAAKSHDPLRWNTETGGGVATQYFGVSSEIAPVPFLSNPTECGGEPLDAAFSVDSWEHPGRFSSPVPMGFGPIVGCDRLTMEPEVTAEPSTSSASAPTGLSVNMTIPQTYDDPEGLATPNLKKAVVILPEGMTVNPSAGAGLAACTQAEFEEEAIQYLPGQGCPNNSKLGTIRSQTPAVKEELTGSVYLAQPYENKFKSLLALYVVGRIANRGVLVKIAGEVKADPATGRLITTFEDLPPLPFSTFTFSFRQGATSPLVTPPACGQYTVAAELTPWANPQAPPLTPAIPAFTIDKGFTGGACPAGGLSPFAPQVLAGTEDNNAGSYSPMYIRVIRGDGEQEITRFSAALPEGLTANLSGVPFCSDAQIEVARHKSGGQEEVEPSCPPASQIGHTLVGAGVGSVLAWAPGRVYMAGPYNGAPFSIVAITAAKVGPFDLGTVVVREALEINPITAAVTVDATASDPIPHIIDGIVIHVRDIRVYINKADFTLNPTDCERLNYAVTVSGSGANFASAADDVPVTVNDPFQAADCQSLKFKPSFKVSVGGRTSRKNGAGLTVKLAYPNAPQGMQANIRSVKVDLPKQLPSRLTTLQKACTASTFEANPAACPAASRVGLATAVTPILPVALTGPAYFVSYGGAKFPELVVVLQGYGVTIDLHGETFINPKTSITSSTFRTVPDQPVTSFQLTLPSGPDSALAANGNLCKSKLTMPTAFTAQNGLSIHQSTPIGVSGCPKQKVKHKTKPKAKKKAK